MLRERTSRKGSGLAGSEMASCSIVRMEDRIRRRADGGNRSPWQWSNRAVAMCSYKAKSSSRMRSSSAPSWIWLSSMMALVFCCRDLAKRAILDEPSSTSSRSTDR